MRSGDGKGANDLAIQKLTRANELTSEYAPVWKVIAGKSDSNEERLAAAAKGLAANPDAETKASPLSLLFAFPLHLRPRPY